MSIGNSSPTIFKAIGMMTPCQRGGHLSSKIATSFKAHMSGIGVQELVLQALCHCWMLIKDCTKWQDLYALLNKGVIR